MSVSDQNSFHFFIQKAYYQVFFFIDESKIFRFHQQSVTPLLIPCFETKSHIYRHSFLLETDHLDPDTYRFFSSTRKENFQFYIQLSSLIFQMRFNSASLGFILAVAPSVVLSSPMAPFLARRYDNSSIIEVTNSSSLTTTSTLTATHYVTLADGETSTYEDTYPTTITSASSQSSSAASDSSENAASDNDKEDDSVASLETSSSSDISSIFSSSSASYCEPTTVTVTVGLNSSNAVPVTLTSFSTQITTLTIPVTAVVTATGTDGSLTNATATTDVTTVLNNVVSSEYTSYYQASGSEYTTNLKETVYQTVTVTSSAYGNGTASYYYSPATGI
mgnify:CR=1 FL=1